MDETYAINIARTELREGYNAGSVERVLSVFADGFADWTDTMPGFYGSDAVNVLRARLQRLFDEYVVVLEQVIIGIWISGDLGVDTGWLNFNLKSKSNGEAKYESRRYLAVWERTPEHGWRIRRYIDNQEVEPRLAAEVIAEIRKQGQVRPS